MLKRRITRTTHTIVVVAFVRRLPFNSITCIFDKSILNESEVVAITFNRVDFYIDIVVVERQAAAAPRCYIGMRDTQHTYNDVSLFVRFSLYSIVCRSVVLNRIAILFFASHFSRKQ